MGIPCAALSGANIATEVAEEQWGETTIAMKHKEKDGELFHKVISKHETQLINESSRSVQLFQTSYLSVAVIDDYTGLQICGALKNVIAVGAGICDGLKYVRSK